MATYNKFDKFVFHLGMGYHALGTHVLKVYLTNNAPSNSADEWKADLVGLSEANGYTERDIEATWANTVQVSYLNGNDITWTASGGNFGPFQYVVLYNDNATDGNNVDGLIAWWDYGTSINCNNGESFTWDLPANGAVANLT